MAGVELRSRLTAPVLQFGMCFWFSFFLKGGVSLPRFVSEEKKDKCVSNMLLVSL